MGIFTGIIVYLMIFWVALFTVLPWGVRAETDKPAGHMGGAPQKPRIREKFLVTLALSAVIWALVYLMVRVDVIDFYAMADKMLVEDFGE